MMGRLLVCAGLFALCSGGAAEPLSVAHFHREVQPLLEKYCSDCHADGANKGGIAFDELKTDDAILKHELWLKVIKNVRAGLMPPEKKPRPSAQERQKLEDWIKYEAFGIDPKKPDPGRAAVRRLNRVEYHNTVRDLLGVEFDAENEFPPDDTGYGFDNIGDVLTVSPMLLEKYLAAAKVVVTEAVPSIGRMMPERTIGGNQFHRGDNKSGREDNGKRGGRLSLSYYEPASVSNTFRAEHDGHYQLVVALSANEKYVEGKFDYNKCCVLFKVDGEEVSKHEYGREGGRPFHYEFERELKTGDHELAFELQPITPTQPQERSLNIRLESVIVRGPYEEKYWLRPKNYERIFTKDAPTAPAERRAYAAELLGNFATRAFRRPSDKETVDRLVTLAESVYTQPGKAFEAGITHGMIAILASPRFLFREEAPETPGSGQTYALVDEYGLASRLSYFLWSSMPDQELFQLAATKQLRKNLPAQVKRMLADPRSKALTQNFVGQWLQARDIETVVLDARAILVRDSKVDPEMDRRRARFRELRNKRDETLTAEEKEEMAKMRAEFNKRANAVPTELSGEIRRAMRSEAEMYFSAIVHEDRNVAELIDSDYTFLNERLAKHYGLTNLNVSGDEMRRVTLPADNARGGILTMGGVLAVTSNPTRTSPVKRGLFVLDNILGLPPAPPPPNIPPLEDAAKNFAGREPTLREMLEFHRSKPLCSSCHNRMDPMGLALENFNAMGMWREKERDQPITVAGALLTGESFDNIKDLKRILVKNHLRDFYQCLTEKVLTYATGRGIEYYDVETVDKIVQGLENDQGRFSALLMGVIESAPFQKCRVRGMLSDDKSARPVQQRADSKVKP